MNYLILLALTWSLNADVGALNDVVAVAFNENAVEVEVGEEKCHFEHDHNDLEIGSVIKPLEIEAALSVDATIEIEMAHILNREQLESEEIKSPIPHVEDLSLLGSRAMFINQESKSMETSDPYESLPVTPMDKQKIHAILTTMAENNVFKLLFQKKYLEKLGRDIHHVHPVRFLGVVFSDPRLVNCMHEIRRTGFKWEGFIDGISQRFSQELKAGNIHAYIPGFAKSLSLNAEEIMGFLDVKSFEGLEGLVLYLMEKSR